jgi:tRNA/rRNA methyltransferase
MNIDITSVMREYLIVIPIPCAIVLCKPEESRNIGSVCRAMKTMSCYELRIVGNKQRYSDSQVRTLSVHAADIWDSAVFYEPTTDGLKEAIADCTVSAGTTRRMGQKRKSWGMTPEQFAANAKSSNSGKLALVFGNERTGLTDEELNCCSVAVNIPSNDEFPSLNLSHAVQIMTYTLYRAFDGHPRGYEPIIQSRLSELVYSISGHIERIGLFPTAGKDNNSRFLEGILARAAMSEGEAQRLEQLFKKISYIKTGFDPDK